jgi:hypothetical protein
MDPVLSTIRRHLNAGTLATMTGGPTTPSGGLTAPVAEAGGLMVPLGGPTDHPIDDTATQLGGMTAPPGSLIVRVVEAGSLTGPPGGPTVCVVHADGPTATLGDPSPVRRL